jgi:hypothetical protein
MIVSLSLGNSPEGCRKLAGGNTPGHRRRMPPRPGGARDPSFGSFGSYCSLPAGFLERRRTHVIGYTMRACCRAAVVPPGQLTLTESLFIGPHCRSLPAKAGVHPWLKSFVPWCLGGENPFTPKIPKPNSTVELGQRPFNWGLIYLPPLIS